MYKTPRQLATEALEQVPQMNAGVDPRATSPTSSQIGQPVDNFENKKMSWINEARRLNPGVDGDTLTKLYDQRIATSEADGTKPWIKDKLSVEQTDAKIQDHAKKSLTYPDEASNHAFLAGIMRGIKDNTQGLKQMYLKLGEHHDILDKIAPIIPGGPGLALSLLVKKQKAGTSEKYRDEVNKEIFDYEKKTEDNSFSAGSGRLVGNVIATLPLGGAGIEEAIGRPLIGKLMSGAAIGSLVGGLSFDPTGEHRAARAMFGGLLGTLSTASFHGALKVFKWLGKKPTLIDDPAVLEAAAERVKNAKDLGIDRLTAGAATRDPEIQTIEGQMLKKTGAVGNLFRKAHQEISQQIHNTGQKMIDAMGGKPRTEQVLGEDMQTALESTKKLARSNISDMYTTAAEAPGADRELPREDLLKTLEDLKKDYLDFRLTPRMQEEFDKMGEVSAHFPEQGLYDTKILTPENLKEHMQAGKPKIGEVIYNNSYNVKTANKLIPGLNKVFRTTDNDSLKEATGILLSKIYDSVDTLADDEANPSRTLFNLARHLRRQLADIYDEKDIVGMLIRHKSRLTRYISPEHVASRIFGSKENITNLDKIEGALKYEIPVDKWMTEAKRLNPALNLTSLKNIYDSKIIPLQKDNAALWEDLKASKLNDIFKNSTVYINGVPQLSYKALVKEVKAMGTPALSKVFGDKELATKFDKLISTMDAWQNKAPTLKNQDSAIKAIHKASGGIFTLIGEGQTRIGGILHYPFTLIKNMLQHINDVRWIRANLTLGAADTPAIVDVMKKSPHLIDNILNTLKRNKELHKHLESAGLRGVVGGAIAPQGQIPVSQQLEGAQ